MGTLKQDRSIKALSENVGISKGKAMRIGGYSHSTANTPQRLTNSQAYIEWAKTQLPPEKLFKAHRESLDATKWNDFTGEREADHSIRLKAAVEGYKVLGVGALNSNGAVSNTQINIVIDDKGFMPKDNILGYKPTLRRK